jgi:hypothetical protein
MHGLLNIMLHSSLVLWLLIFRATGFYRGTAVRTVRTVRAVVPHQNCQLSSGKVVLWHGRCTVLARQSHSSAR